MAESWLRFLAPVLHLLGIAVGPVISIVALICLLRYRRLAPQCSLMLSGLAVHALTSVCRCALYVADWCGNWAGLARDGKEWRVVEEFQTVLWVSGWVSTAGWICFWFGLILVLQHVKSRLEAESSNDGSRWDDGSLEE